jgi:hypothetical protein
MVSINPHDADRTTMKTTATLLIGMTLSLIWIAWCVQALSHTLAA